MERPVGRPTKYKPEYCEALIEHMRQGFSFESFGATIGVGRDKVYAWAKEHEEFREAKALALDASMIFWETQGVKGTWNNKDGPTLNSSVWIFNMKNRFGWRDNKDVNIATSGTIAPQIIVSLPDNGRQAPTIEGSKDDHDNI